MNIKNMTANDIQAEMNRWLKLKWHHADYNTELPTAQMALNRFNEIIMAEIKSGEAEACMVCSPLLGQSANSSIWTRVFVDTDIEQQDQTPAKKLRFIAYVEGIKVSLMSFNLDMRHEVDGEDTCHAVKAVERIAGDASSVSLLEMLFTASQRLHATSKNVFSLWLQTPASYREKHLICPACGSDASMCHTDYGRRTVCCTCCHWCGHWKYYYANEFVQELAFSKELRRTRKIEATNSAILKAEAQVITSLQELKSIAEDKHKYLVTPERYAAAIKRIAEQMPKATGV